MNNSDLTLFFNSTERFSPSLICEKFNLTLKDAYLACENIYKSQTLDIGKWFRVICPFCDSKVIAGEFEQLKSVKISNCPECLSRFEIDDSDIQIFYTNETLKKKEYRSEQTAPPITLNSTTLAVIDAAFENNTTFFNNKRGMIWQISDLHLRGTPSIYPGGHNKVLIRNFLSVVAKRGNSISKDYFIFSGDVTDCGSAEDEVELVQFIKSLTSLGANPHQILLIPGNHDTWNGASRVKMSLSYLRSDSRLLKKAGNYEKRNYILLLSKFNTQSSELYKFKLNGREIELILINTSIKGEMARGMFPNANVIEPTSPHSFKIATMHHHLIIPDDSDYDYGWSYFSKMLHRPTMRVINASVGLNYLFSNNFNLSLHGHKHLQYFKFENQLNEINKRVLIASCPSLCEDKFDNVRGRSKESNRIGFNVILPGKDRVDLIQLELYDWKFRITKEIPIGK